MTFLRQFDKMRVSKPLLGTVFVDKIKEINFLICRAALVLTVFGVPVRNGFSPQAAATCSVTDSIRSRALTHFSPFDGVCQV